MLVLVALTVRLESSLEKALQSPTVNFSLWLPKILYFLIIVAQMELLVAAGIGQPLTSDPAHV